jgi:hypothetical protein
MFSPEVNHTGVERGASTKKRTRDPLASTSQQRRYENETSKNHFLTSKALYDDFESLKRIQNNNSKKSREYWAAFEQQNVDLDEEFCDAENFVLAAALKLDPGQSRDRKIAIKYVFEYMLG